MAKTILVLMFIFLLSINALCQRNLSPQAQSGIELFDNKEYTKSVLTFQKLLQKFPKDPLYQFYLAASLIEMNNSSNQVEDYLKFACAKNTDPRSWYYLGKNYYRQFRFQEAKEALNEFKKVSNWSLNKEFSILDEIERVTKAQTFFSKSLEINVYGKQLISEDSICILFNIPKTNKFLITQNDLPSGKNYFFSIVKNWQKGKDIYVSRKLNDTLWSEYENIGIKVNTNEDEDFPIFDEYSNTLYFASKGHGSVGGFDIFYSKYDSLKKEWSNPVQLQYPINTQWDDFIFKPSDENFKLVSNRDNFYGKATIYSIDEPSKEKFVALNTAEEMLQACMLKINKFSPEKAILNKVPEKKSNTDTSEITKEELIVSISKALDIQKQSDSLLNRENKIKEELNYTTDKDKRAQLFSELKKNTKVLNDLQAKANKYYVQANSSQFSLAPNKKLSRSKTSPAKEFKDTSNIQDAESEFPNGIIYRIQLGVFSKRVSEKLFEDFQPLSTEYLMNGKIIKYYFGFFNQFNQADISLNKVKESGFTEAFIVAYYNAKKIPVDRAKELEKLEY